MKRWQVRYSIERCVEVVAETEEEALTKAKAIPDGEWDWSAGPWEAETEHQGRARFWRREMKP